MQIGAMVVLAGVASCTDGATPSPDGRAAAAATASDSASDSDADRFVTVKRDLRRCAPPLCGGYFLHDVNTETAPVYVSKLVFEGPGLDEATVNTIHDAPAFELLLRGHLGAADPTFGIHVFLVREAYRGLPGKAPQAADTFYDVTKHVPPIECITTPCPTHVAALLNADAREDIDRVALDDAAMPFVDKSWLLKRIEHDGALVAGQLTEPRPIPGTERLLLASQVFLHLPEHAGPCPEQPVPSCGEQMATFRRTADRCLVFDRCVEPTSCEEPVVTCAEDYRLSGWPAAPAGCSVYTCDPAFATP